MIEVKGIYILIYETNSIMEKDQFYPELPEGRYECSLTYDRIVFCDGSEIEYLRKIKFNNGDVFINIR